MKRISVIVPNEVDRALRWIARNEDRPLQRVYRQALQEFLASRDHGIGEEQPARLVEPIEDPVPRRKGPSNG
jgi:predicted transcriptional regulator